MTVSSIAGGVSDFLDSELKAIGGLSPDDGGFIVGNGSTFTLRTGAVARTSIGLGTADNVQFTGITGTGVLSIDDVTNSTSTTTGSLHTDGGLGVAKAFYLGGTILSFVNIPTSDPSVAGRLYSNSGVVRVSAG